MRKRCSFNNISGAMTMALLLMVAGLCGWARPLAAAELDLNSLPNFVFDDDRLEILLRVLPESGVKKENRQRFALLEIGGETERMPVRIPSPDEDAALAHFPLDVSKLKHGSELRFKLDSGESAVAVIYCVKNECSGLRVVIDHFEDAGGRRVIMVLPRPNEGAHRRWLPFKAARDLFVSAKDNALLLGSSYGSGEYATELEKLFGAKGRKLSVALSDGDAAPVFSLLLEAFRNRGADVAEVVVFPGIDDISSGTPPQEYYMALHAVAAVFGGKRVSICTPPPSAEPQRAAAYRQTVELIGRERHIPVIHLEEAFDNSGESSSPLYPGIEKQKQVAEAISQRRGTGSSFAVLLPIMIFLVGSGGIFWLWAGARYREKAG